MRAKLWIICFAPLVLTGCLSGARGPAVSASADAAVVLSGESRLAKALAHFAQGRLLEEDEGRDSHNALKHYTLAALASPENHEIASRIAVIAIHRRDPDTAIKALERSWRTDPASYDRTVDLAAIYQAVGRFEDALIFYAKALERDTTSAAVYIASASILFHQDRDEHALALLETGYRDADKPHLLGIYLYEQAKRFLVRDALDRSLLCFELLSEWDEAAKPRIYAVLADLYLAAKRTSDALHILRKATQLPDPDPNVFVTLASWLARNDPEEALTLLHDARHRFGENPEILFALGSIYSDTQRYEEAIPLFEAARRQIEEDTPHDDELRLSEAFYIYQGAAYERSGRIAESEAVFEQCLRHYPDSHIVMNYLAYMWAEADTHLDQALKYSIHSLTFEPENGAYLDTLGWIYFKMGLHEIALETLERARALLGHDHEILLHIGDVHEALGNLDGAVSFWEKSVEANPGETNRAVEQLRQHGRSPAPTPGQEE